MAGYAPSFHSHEEAKKQSHRSDRTILIVSYPIGQALAPYLAAGCRAVIGLVPRALFIGVIQLRGYNTTHQSGCKQPDFFLDPRLIQIRLIKTFNCPERLFYFPNHFDIAF